eukprot:1180609-Prorocentrum_minimum.AAC.3
MGGELNSPVTKGLNVRAEPYVELRRWRGKAATICSSSSSSCNVFISVAYLLHGVKVAGHELAAGVRVGREEELELLGDGGGAELRAGGDGLHAPPPRQHAAHIVH